MGFTSGESLWASLAITALGCLSQPGARGGNWTNGCVIQRCSLAIMGSKWETPGTVVRNQGEQGCPSSLALAPKPVKNPLLPYTSELTLPRCWDHPTCSQCYSTADATLRGLTALGFIPQFPWWPSQISFLLPLNGLLLYAEHHRGINPHLLHFSC